MSGRARVVVITITAFLLAFLSILASSPRAQAAAPSAPTLVAPADNSTASSLNVPLSVTASDPDGGAIDVRFEGRKKGATVPGGSGGAPFTLVALPDTQNYTYNNRQATMSQQAQWVLNTRTQLNTAMVVQLGDLVSEYPNTTQWGRTSTALKLMDDAGMPNTVVAGNHDFNNVTGDATEYNTYFPPSRYAGKPWTPSTARYGGYLGQNLFGPDPIDRGNMDNFALFSAGGRDFLVLNLEWEAPSYALDWARKVLAAYPNRIAIMVTHSFVSINGQRRTTTERPGGTPPNTIWNEFVSQQCSIKLVLNGHFHDGNLGEANRSDLNRCGQPVQQLLTDYQDRPNGGDGWLRYYTFDPGANTMKATTYSPKLNQFEIDADSSFTLPFDLSEPQPAPFTQIATVRVNSGQTASTTWSGLDPDTAYEWRAVAGDGTGSTTSATWTLRTPPSTDYVDDTFTRNVTNGWGAADAAHAWQLNSAATSYSVNGSVGKAAVPVGAGRNGTVTGVSATDVRVRAELSMAQAATGSGTYASLMARVNGSTSYRSKLRYLANGSLSLTVGRVVGGTETTIATATVPGVTATPGLPLRFILEAEGTSPTTLRAKVWPAASAEPSAWTVTGTDSTAALQVPGTAGLDLYVSGTASGGSALSFDRFTVSRLGAVTPPANPALARDAFGRTATNGWGSAEIGGAWTFNGATSRFSVANGKGVQALTAPGNTADSSLAAVSSASTELRVSLAWSRTGSAGMLYGSVLPRRLSSTTDYRCKVMSGSDGAVRVILARRVSSAETALASATISGLTLTANQAYQVACSATPSGNATQLRAKLWRSGSAEPASWQVTGTDSTAALQVAGGIGISSYLSSSATAGVTLSVDDLVATKP